MAERMSVAIVAPVHNRKNITLQCLRSISRLNSEGLDISVVIVDDGSTDGTSAEINSEFPTVDVVKGDGNLWFTEGTNVGVRRALEYDPEFVLMINDDQVFDSESVASMVRTATKYPRSVVGPLLLLWDMPHRLFQTAPVWSTWRGDWRHWYQQTVWTVPDDAFEVDIIVGNCVLVPSAAFRECGLMDSRRYPNFGDAEFTPRLKRLGWRLVIDPRARVFCQPNTPPPRVRHMTFMKKVSALIFDLGNSHNLRRRLYASLDGAPSRLEGLVAFIMFALRVAMRRPGEDPTAAEPPLKDTFRPAIVK
jgi:GT2 family glycosyltransferase